jgi:ribosomal protein S18 acetylase RimI-like enzyme
MIERIDVKEFDRIYEIMEKSFPADERRPYSEQKQLLSLAEYSIFVSRDALSGEISSFIAAWRLDGLLFIEHFATAPEYRGQGVGGRLLDEVITGTDGDVCLEVEPPDSDICRRRIGFYERHGFFLNDYPYVQPPISSGRSSVVLMLMTARGKIVESRFAEIRDMLYRRVYKCM